MPTTDYATDIAPPGLQAAESAKEDGHSEATRLAPHRTSKLLKVFLFGFAASVTIGLALASWYVGVRIVAAEQVAPANAPRSQPPTERTAGDARPSMDARQAMNAPAATSAAPRAASRDLKAAGNKDTAPPHPLYLQVAGFGTQQDTDFATSLQARGFQAQVQALDAGATRILIGPFSTDAAMKQAQRKLQSAGVIATETTH